MNEPRDPVLWNKIKEDRAKLDRAEKVDLEVLRHEAEQAVYACLAYLAPAKIWGFMRRIRLARNKAELDDIITDVLRARDEAIEYEKAQRRPAPTTGSDSSMTPGGR